MSDLITNFTQNSAGAVTTLNGSPVTETVMVNATVNTIPLTAASTSPALIPTTPVAQLPLTGTPVLPTTSGSSSNPNSRGINDVSDTQITSKPVSLPIRGEKRFIPTKVDVSELDLEFNDVKSSDFYTYANTEAKRLQNGVDYIKIKIPHRGFTPGSLLPDPTQAVEYRFLVNPSTLTVNRQTVDSQSFTRGGWQFGVWGEDPFMVQMQGTSAGAYFSNGLTDEFSYYAVSYRNTMQLQQVFENNGYFFEGEEYNEGPLAADYLRRRIRMHQDVELWAGNFIWFGMFDSFTLSQDAERPFLLNFTLSFFVWKEKYRSTSPYWGSIENNVQRGHSYSAVVRSGGESAGSNTNNTLAQYAPAAVTSQASQMAGALFTPANTPYSNSPAVQSSTADDLVQPGSSIISDQIGLVPMQQLALPNIPTNKAFWKGSTTKPLTPAAANIQSIDLTQINKLVGRS